jgi:hypothetical protein
MIKKPKRVPQPRQPPVVPSSQQFNATPRFHFAPSQRSSVSDALYREETPLAHQYSTPARPRDLIEDNSGAIDFDIHQSVESVEPNFAQGHLSTDEDNDYSARRRSSKRRRLSPSPILDSQDQDHVEQQHENSNGNFSGNHNGFEDFVPSAESAISSPPAEPLHRAPSSTTAPRFILPSTPAPVPSSTPATTQTAAFVKPPRFRPPDDQEHQQRPSEPLPDAFSPQRRGQKFLTGGLAAEVISWVMNLESITPAASSAQSKEDAWVVELIVDEVRGGPGAGMTLISGRQIHVARSGQEGEMVSTLRVVKIILAGSGTNEGFQKTIKVDVRKKIRIKSPVWEVVIEGEKWGVAVSWEVLN